MEAQKPNKPANTSKKKTGINAFLVIILCFIASICMYVFVLGNPANFENGHPTNLLGTVHEGGFVVPIIWGLVFMVIVFTVERFIALKKAAGKKSADKFVGDLKKALESGNVAAAKKVCDDQSGAIGAAVGCAVAKYEEMLAAEKEINKICSYLNELNMVATRYHGVMQTVDGVYRRHLNALDAIININKKVDWLEFTPQERLVTQNTVLLVQLLY